MVTSTLERSTRHNAVSYLGSMWWVGLTFLDCGNSLASGSGSAPTSDCNMACSGNATEACGGPNRLNLYWSGTTGPSTNLGVGNWSFSGCYTWVILSYSHLYISNTSCSEGTTGRALTNGLATTGGSGSMTVALCLSTCQAAGYPLAGVEYSGECCKSLA
jgi:hypothetical protein